MFFFDLGNIYLKKIASYLEYMVYLIYEKLLRL